MMTDFRNPYHFVPLREAAALGDRTSAEEFKDRSQRLQYGHARYLPTTPTQASERPRFSGRIVCRLVTETPLVVGGKQARSDPNSYAKVEPYMFRGKPAIPGSSLKGMITSIAEAASGSAMRVLHNRKALSYRKAMGDALHAIGMIEQDPKDKRKLLVRPLTLPLMAEYNGSLVFAKKGDLWSTVFKKAPFLKAYIGEYPKKNKNERDYTLQPFLEAIGINGNRDILISALPEYYARDMQVGKFTSKNEVVGIGGKLVSRFDQITKTTYVMAHAFPRVEGPKDCTERVIG